VFAITIGNTTLWSIAAAIPVLITEYLFRTQTGGWLANLHYYLPLQMAVSYCVYRLVTEPDTSLVEAFVAWAVCTTIGRVILSTLVLHDDIKAGTWFALGLILMAKVAQSFWR
jgi:hypothetical protein